MEPNIRETFDILLEALANDTIPTTQVYATSEQIERGKVFHVDTRDGVPAFFLAHPDDMDMIRAGLPRYITLVHLRDWKVS